jgi:hypothetical protein
MKKIIFTLFVVFLASPVAAQQQWQLSNGPFGGTIYSLFDDGKGFLYVSRTMMVTIGFIAVRIMTDLCSISHRLLSTLQEQFMPVSMDQIVYSGQWMPD